VFVLSSNREDGVAQGSGRSIPAFHLLDALEDMPDLFVRFGGHKQAAGVGLDAARVSEFRERLNARATALLRPEDFERVLEIDGVLELRDVNEAAAEEVFLLAPFGYGNPQPVFAAMDVEVAAPPLVFADKHLRLTVRHESRKVSLKCWNLAEHAGELTPGTRLDVAFTLEEDPYSASRGYPGWAAVLRDVRPAQQG